MAASIPPSGFPSRTRRARRSAPRRERLRATSPAERSAAGCGPEETQRSADVRPPLQTPPRRVDFGISSPPNCRSTVRRARLAAGDCGTVYRERSALCRPRDPRERVAALPAARQKPAHARVSSAERCTQLRQASDQSNFRESSSQAFPSAAMRSLSSVVSYGPITSQHRPIIADLSQH